MSSPSASGRSNGNRLVSASALIKKITNDTDSGTMNQACAVCCCTITCDSVTLPASSKTATVLRPSAISYEIICADARSPPSSAYLLFDAHPASTIPYTPSELIARIYRNPTGRSATTMGTSRHRGRRLFLQKVLQTVGGRLENTLRADTVGAEAVLHPGAHPPFEQRQQRHPNHDQVEDDEDLDRGRDEEKRHDTPARPSAATSCPSTQAAGCAMPGAGFAW